MLGAEGQGEAGYTFPASPGNLQIPDARLVFHEFCTDGGRSTHYRDRGDLGHKKHRPGTFGTVLASVKLLTEPQSRARSPWQWLPCDRCCGAASA